MIRLTRLLCAAFLAGIPAAAAAGSDGCQLCSENRDASREAPLRVEIISGIDFSRMALSKRGEGSALIDPVTGSKATQGGLRDLGGLAFQGRAKVTGSPLRNVRIELPMRVVLRSHAGHEAILRNFTTDASPAPMLDANGQLEFAFGATLDGISGGGGNFRGRIPIRVDYN
jgi:hypothetical protein